MDAELSVSRHGTVIKKRKNREATEAGTSKIADVSIIKTLDVTQNFMDRSKKLNDSAGETVASGCIADDILAKLKHIISRSASRCDRVSIETCEDSRISPEWKRFLRGNSDCLREAVMSHRFSENAEALLQGNDELRFAFYVIQKTLAA